MNDTEGQPNRKEGQAVIYLSLDDGQILVRIRAEGRNDMRGDLGRALRPGQQFMGKPYSYWAALGPGRHEVPTGG
jgi:hypothetical protein